MITLPPDRTSVSTADPDAETSSKPPLLTTVPVALPVTCWMPPSRTAPTARPTLLLRLVG